MATRHHMAKKFNGGEKVQYLGRKDGKRKTKNRKRDAAFRNLKRVDKTYLKRTDATYT